MKQLIPHNAVPALLLAGRATLIFENKETGNTRIFKVIKNKKSGYYRVIGKWYLGWIRDKVFHPNQDMGIVAANEMVKAFEYLYNHLLAGTLSDKIIVYHTGRCCACNRTLTDPKSIELGIGPQCRGEM